MTAIPIRLERNISSNDKFEIIQTIDYLPYQYFIEFKINDKYDSVWYGLSETSGGNNLEWQGLNVNNLHIPIYPKRYGPDIDVLYLEIFYSNEAGQFGPLQIPIDLKLDLTRNKPGSYEFKIDFSEANGFDPVLLEQFKAFEPKIVTIIEEVIGKSVLPGKVKWLFSPYSYFFTSDQHAIYFPDVPNWFNYVHEVCHAFKKVLGMSTNAFHQYDEALSIWEESFCQAYVFKIIQLYNERYPNNEEFKDYKPFNTAQGNYDYANDEHLSNTSLQSDQNGMGLSSERYNMSAVAIQKIERTYEAKHKQSFYAAFFEELYHRFAADPTLIMSAELFIEILSKMVPWIEYSSLRLWIKKQHVLVSKVIPGEKIFVNFQNYFLNDEFIARIRIYLYETFQNGSDWYDSNGALYSKNGSTGNLEIKNHKGESMLQQEIQILPSENPPELNQYGSFNIYISNKQEFETTFASKMTPVANRIWNQLETGLYEITIRFGNTIKTFYQPLGKDIHNYNSGVVIGFKNNPSGFVKVKWSEFYQIKNGLLLMDKAIQNEDLILSLYEGEGYKLKPRNIRRSLGEGNYYGGHFLLID